MHHGVGHMVGYSPGKSRVEYPRLPPPQRHQTLGRPCSDIWWWPLKPYGFERGGTHLTGILSCSFMRFSSLVLPGSFQGIPLVPCPFLGRAIQGVEYQWALGYPGGGGGYGIWRSVRILLLLFIANEFTAKPLMALSLKLFFRIL